MNYPVTTSLQLRAVLRGMRKACAMTQAQVGQLLGVNQKRAARIESAPGVTSFDQIARLVAALGGRLVIEMRDTPPSTGPAVASKGGTRKSAVPATKIDPDAW
jgi:HTH-type transcriptional regulator / antitoxin HipB